MKRAHSDNYRHSGRDLLGARASADQVRGVKECHLGPRDGLASRDELVDSFPNGDGSGQAGNAGADDDNMRTHGGALEEKAKELHVVCEFNETAEPTRQYGTPSS